MKDINFSGNIIGDAGVVSFHQTVFIKFVVDATEGGYEAREGGGCNSDNGNTASSKYYDE